METASSPSHPRVGPLDDIGDTPFRSTQGFGPCILFFRGLDYLEFVLREARDVVLRTEFVLPELSLLLHPEDQKIVGFHLNGFKALAREFEEKREERNRGFSPSMIDLIKHAYHGGDPTDLRKEYFGRVERLAASSIIPMDAWKEIIS